MTSGAREAFARITATLDYPMFVLTVGSGDGERSGCLVGFASQCSIDPARFMVCVSKRNHTFGLANAAEVLVLHVLRDVPHDRDLARLFGEETGDEVDKFARCDWDAGPGGTPVLRDCDWFAGRVVDRVDCGDHVGFLVDVIDEGGAPRSREPQLGFQAVRDLDPGHEA
jgi:flavin reductase (DIM6/NTAB) family NADH-FMN oxidoreductase RutF